MADRQTITALSAQPSPGGQGDARSFVIAAYRKDGKHSIADAMEDGSHFPPYVQRAVNAVEAALAARQPVGEPVFYLSKADADYIAARTSNANQVVAIRNPRSKNAVPFYATPPAQTVDMTSAQAVAVYDAVTRRNFTRDVKTYEDKARTVMAALTDSQAVGNGQPELPA